ncbi:MAG: hypothetical protein JW955_13335, partial [Sedimentisphaerales bacterium]|nr:hypothetical protein [Sedimentisphaerales bacterium]
MRRLRISGLVGFAKRVREEVAGPVSPGRLAELRGEVEDTIRAIEQIVRDKGARLENLPLPSRKAYQFVKGLDLDSLVVSEESAPAGRFPPDSVSFHGLRGHFDGLLDQLARSDGPSRLEKVYETIRSDSESIENEVTTQNLRPEQLKRQARQVRGWLAYFAQRENFEAYCAAIRRAEPVFRGASTWPAGSAVAVLVHFRPMRGMYHIRGYSDAILVHLPTPMICFDEALLRCVAEIAFKRTQDRELVHDAAGSEPYRRIASALELLGGVVTQTRGVHHDLAASFDRVNAAYFNGSLSRPHLVWSRTFATRKFGHYDHANDSIMINAALDRKTVPQFAVDFIMYHELLHRQLGIAWKGNRIAAHTEEFMGNERAFKEYDQARAVLRKLAAER